MAVKCPNCGSANFDLGDYTHDMAYDDVVDAINATEEKDEGFSVRARCSDCGCEFYINFEIVSREIIKD